MLVCYLKFLKITNNVILYVSKIWNLSWVNKFLQPWCNTWLHSKACVTIIVESSSKYNKRQKVGVYSNEKVKVNLDKDFGEKDVEDKINSKKFIENINKDKHRK